jgi:hypothetical protein
MVVPALSVAVGVCCAKTELAIICKEMIRVNIFFILNGLFAANIVVNNDLLS